MRNKFSIWANTLSKLKQEAERIIVEGFLEPLSRNMSYQVRAWISNILLNQNGKVKNYQSNMDEQSKGNC